MPEEVVLEPFATVEDLEKRWRSLAGAERDRAGVLLVDASSLIRDTCTGWARSAADTRRRICCAIVQRAMAAGDEDAGATSMTDTTGPFTTQRTFSNPRGDMFLTAAEKRALGCGAASAFTITLTGDAA